MSSNDERDYARENTLKRRNKKRRLAHKNSSVRIEPPKSYKGERKNIVSVQLPESIIYKLKKLKESHNRGFISKLMRDAIIRALNKYDTRLLTEREEIKDAIR